MSRPERAPLAGALALLFTAACGGRAEEPAAGPVWFEELHAAAGVDFVHASGAVPGRYLMPEIVCGGGALLDADGDGRLDLYLVQSGSLTEPGGASAANRLYLNRTAPGGPLAFVDASAESGADDRGYGMGAATGDFDGDGDVDLYVTNLGPDVLLVNEGGGRFRDATAAAGLGHPGWSTSASFADLDGDGDLDLYVTTYLEWSLASEITCYDRMGGEDYCHPANYLAPVLDVLYENLGDGTFRDVSRASGIAAKPGNGLGVVCEDFDGDGRLDVFVANDSLPDWLWRNEGALRFRDVAARAGCSVDASGIAKAGMGVAAEDTDDDGDFDLLVCNLDQQTDSLFENTGGTFRDRTLLSGLGAASRRFTRFGVGWTDFDRDGDLDLYEANGRVNHQATRFSDDPYAEPNLLLEMGDDGRLHAVDPPGGTAAPLHATSRAALFGDLDDDGAVDVVVVNRDAPVHLLRCVAPARGKWLGLDPREPSGAPALGALVRVRTDARTLTRRSRTDGSYLAARDPRIVVGLSSGEAVREVRVRWADGAEERFGAPAPGRYHRLERGRGHSLGNGGR